jgi:hypothetical protein
VRLAGYQTALVYSANIILQNISKALWKDAKLKCCEEIGDWHQSITNMVWWAIETSRGRINCHSAT